MYSPPLSLKNVPVTTSKLPEQTTQKHFKLLGTIQLTGEEALLY